MNWKELSKNESKVLFDDFTEDVATIKSMDDKEYQELKKLIEDAFDKALDTLNITKDELSSTVGKYKFDCYFGYETYKIFSEGKYKMGEREASNDDIWRYIQMKIIPELLFYRWTINMENRIYNQSNRLYLKVLWWYYHLSFKNNYEETLQMLLDPSNSSDTIVALVERCGNNGYRIDLYRKIMYEKTKNKIDTKPFRKMMVLNSAMIKVVNPYLTENGIDGYVSGLIAKVKGE